MDFWHAYGNGFIGGMLVASAYWVWVSLRLVKRITERKDD